MATWTDLIEKGLGFAGLGADAYILVRQRESENKIAQSRAAADAAKAEADLMTSKANHETLVKFGQWAMYAAAGMLGLTLLAQLRRMWKAK